MLHAGPGPLRRLARGAAEACCRSPRWRCVPVQGRRGRLLGGLDLARDARGRPPLTPSRGLRAAADGGHAGAGDGRAPDCRHRGAGLRSRSIAAKCWSGATAYLSAPAPRVSAWSRSTESVDDDRAGANGGCATTARAAPRSRRACTCQTADSGCAARDIGDRARICLAIETDAAVVETLCAATSRLRHRFCCRRRAHSSATCVARAAAALDGRIAGRRR